MAERTTTPVSRVSVYGRVVGGISLAGIAYFIEAHSKQGATFRILAIVIGIALIVSGWKAELLPRGKKLLGIAARAVLYGLVVVVVVLRVADNLPKGFTYPNGFSRPETYPFKFEEVGFKAEDGTFLSAWFVPAPQSRRVLLVFHGSAVNLGYLGRGLLESLSRLGQDILALDYRGYGKSQGSADADALTMDAEAAWRYLIQVRKFHPGDVFIYGHSIGAAVAIELATRHPCGGLIVQSGFTSSRETARSDMSVPLLEYALKQRFNSIETIARVRSPVLVIHGVKDSVIPFEMGKRLFDAASSPKAFFAIANADHDDFFIEGGQEYHDRLLRFILTGS